MRQAEMETGRRGSVLRQPVIIGRGLSYFLASVREDGSTCEEGQAWEEGH